MNPLLYSISLSLALFGLMFHLWIPLGIATVINAFIGYKDNDFSK